MGSLGFQARLERPASQASLEPIPARAVIRAFLVQAATQGFLVIRALAVSVDIPVSQVTQGSQVRRVRRELRGSLVLAEPIQGSLDFRASRDIAVFRDILVLADIRVSQDIPDSLE